MNGEPSPLLAAELPRLRETASLGPALDLACGRGRHALALAAAGLPAIGIDRDRAALRALRAAAAGLRTPVAGVRADLETRFGIPVRAGTCGAILVFRFLYRPLAAAIEAALAPGGLLLYETFVRDPMSRGHGPRNPAFVLEPGELAGLFPGLEVLASWEGLTPAARPEALARLTARRRR